MIRWRVVALSGACLCAFAWQDVLLWQRIFEHNQLAQYSSIYCDGWRVMLDTVTLLGMVFLWRNKFEAAFFAGTLQIMAHVGAEDVLYYWLDGKMLPSNLPWLNDNPFTLKPVTGDSLLLGVGLWLALWVAVWLVMLAFMGHTSKWDLKRINPAQRKERLATNNP